MSSNRQFLFFLLSFLITYQGNDAQSKSVSPFKKCCDLGTSWANEGLRCEKFAGPVADVPRPQQALCLESVDICCNRAYREISCGKGKKTAREGKACVDGSSGKSRTARALGDYQRDCCEGCKLGILTGSLGQGCALDFSFGNPWDPAFLECCRETSTTTTLLTTETETEAESTTKVTTKSANNNNSTSTSSNTTITSSTSSSSTTDLDFDSIFAEDSTDLTDSSSLTTSSDDGIPTPPLDDICQILKNLLCSHICVPTPGSYYCECPKGYVLLEDQKTCRTDGPINRCESDNPCEHRCTDTGTAVKCECDPGFELAKDGHSCQLKPTQAITTTPKPRDKPKDRKKPRCPPGYRFNASARVCDDIDECADRVNLCGAEVCYNQPGGYTCARAPTPITEPTTQDDSEIQSTVKPDDTKTCSEGFKNVRNRGCMDVNECDEVEDACSSNEECVNTVGSYTCNCRIGFRRDNLTQACVDINECQLLENDCLPTQRCDNTLGSYNCVRFLPCGTGYTLNAATEICEDDDECLLGTHDCGEGYHCRNTLGSYRCDRNLRGQTWTTRRPPVTTLAPLTTIKALTTSTTPITITTTTPRPIPPRSRVTPTRAIPTRITPTLSSETQTTAVTSVNTPVIESRNQPEQHSCPRGFESGSSGQCIDIDECYGISNPCARSPLQRCINTVGSYRCVSRVICGAGWTLDPVTSRCVDLDECATGTHECGPDQTCENRQGGYLCSCPAGNALGPNRECIDIDECSMFSGNVCGSGGRCENTVGSYRCVCDAGFEKSSKGTACQDTNECEKSPGICQHNCINIWGSYRCICKPGYRLNSDNRSCTDVDECTEFRENNLCVGICDNTPGSYSCRCPEGYRLGSDARTCQDIDECANGRMCRDPDEICQNTRGSFRCNKINCPAGYHRDPSRMNRCVRSSRYCPSGDLACFRSPSHYSFNFITFVSMLPLPATGQLELFTMRGTHLPGSVVRFSMALNDARAPPGVMRATESCFGLRRPTPSQAVLVLTRMLPGPQDIELDLSMEIYHNNAFAGSAVAKLFIFVTQYEF